MSIEHELSDGKALPSTSSDPRLSGREILRYGLCSAGAALLAGRTGLAAGDPVIGWSSHAQGRWGKRLLESLETGKLLPKPFPDYPVQVWKLDEDQLWISLGGETVVDYALMFKRAFGPRTWVNGHTNEVMSYIPSERVWKEGRYEAGGFSGCGLPAKNGPPTFRIASRLPSSGSSRRCRAGGESVSKVATCHEEGCARRGRLT